MAAFVEEARVALDRWNVVSIGCELYVVACASLRIHLSE